MRPDRMPSPSRRAAKQSSTISYEKTSDPRIMLETLGHLHGDANGGYQLRYLQRVPPGNRATKGSVWDNYHIARLEGSVDRAAAEQSALAANYGPVSPDHKNGLLVCHRRWPASLSQIPA